MSSESQSQTKSTDGRTSSFEEKPSEIEAGTSPNSIQERAREAFKKMRGSLSIERKGSLDRDPGINDTLNDFDDMTARPVNRNN